MVIDGILKLEGYGTYTTYLDGKIWVSPIVLQTNGPTLDADNCIEWSELEEPPNQDFLNIVNAEFGVFVQNSDFDKPKNALSKLMSKIRRAGLNVI